MNFQSKHDQQQGSNIPTQFTEARGLTVADSHPLHQDHPEPLDHTLGTLIRILSSIEPSAEYNSQIPAHEFRSWFLDRFNVPAADCSEKAFGDALSFAIRFGLIPVEKKARTKAKTIHYTGITLPGVEAAWERWRGSEVPYPALRSSTQPTDIWDGVDDSSVTPPWDVDAEIPKRTYLDALIEGLDLNMMDGFFNASSEFDF